jgi:acyl-CoA thioesterase I
VRARQPEAAIALVQMEAPPNLGDSYTRRFHAAYPAAAEATGVPLLPFLLEGVAGDAALNQADGIHPNERGSRVVAATMWKAIAPLLAPSASP